MRHGDGCFGDEFGDDFVFEPVGVVVGGLAEPTGGQGDADAVEAPGAIGIAHQGVFDAVGFLSGSYRSTIDVSAANACAFNMQGAAAEVEPLPPLALSYVMSKAWVLLIAMSSRPHREPLAVI